MAAACGSCVLVLVSVAGWGTPWDWLPGGALPPLDPTGGLGTVQLRRIAAYRSAVVPVSLLAVGLSSAVALALGLTTWGSCLVRRLPGRRRWPVQALLAVALLLAVGQLVTLPLLARVQAVQRSVGLSTQGWAAWGFDLAKGYLVTVVMTAIPVLIVLALARRFRRWWLPAALLSAGLVVAGSFVYPLVVEPLFSSFTPMPASPLRTSLLELAARDDVPVDDVLVADASRRTTAVNAYVSGFGASRRIVVYDTLLQQASPAEVRLVVAHELGHAKRNDVLFGTALGALGSLVGISALALLVSSPRLARRAGYADAGDVAVVPALLALAAAGTLLVAPLQNVVSRAIEARADVHSLDLTRAPATFMATQRRLATANLSPPEPNLFSYLMFASHPSLAQRIAIAQGWAAEHPTP